MNYVNMPKSGYAKGVDYKRELLKYKNSLVALNLKQRRELYKKNAIDFNKLEYFDSCNTLDLRNNLLSEGKLYSENDIHPSGFYSFYDRTLIDDSMELSRNIEIEQKIEELEKEPMITFQEEHMIDFEPDISNQNCFLYHGIRRSNPLTILEKILIDRKILAGKYIEGFYSFEDNCNDGEYVSLISYSDSFGFETFIREHICFIISPFVKAYKTKYLSCEEWDYMKRNQMGVQNRYSYLRDEYQVKDEILLEQVRAIGISNRYLLGMKFTQGVNAANQYIQQIRMLLEKYGVDLPIVDIDFYNTELRVQNKEKIK